MKKYFRAVRTILVLGISLSIWTAISSFYSLSTDQKDKSTGPKIINSNFHLKSALPTNISENMTLNIASYKTSKDSHFPFDILMKPRQNRKDIFLLIFTFTAVDDYVMRDTIRKTWGSYATESSTFSPKCKQIFLIGKPVEGNGKVQLDYEHKNYNDILQYDFLDTYPNLTLKTLSMLDYVSKFYSYGRFFIKADTDVLINIPLFVARFQNLNHLKRSVWGMVNYAQPIQRTGKYRMPEEVLPMQYYPPYTSGPCYFLTVDLVDDLLQQFKRLSYQLLIEDVFVTGILMLNISGHHVHDQDWYRLQIKDKGPMAKCDYKRNKAVCLEYTKTKIMELWNEHETETCADVPSEGELVRENIRLHRKEGHIYLMKEQRVRLKGNRLK